MMRMLKKFTKEGISIVVSIHHPSQEVFRLFDKVMFLSNGETIFYGKRNEIRPYFKKLGYKTTKDMNTADYVMSLILKEELSNKGDSNLRNGLIDKWKSVDAIYEISDGTQDNEIIVYNHLSRLKEIGILTGRSFHQNKGIHLEKYDFIQIVIFAALMGLMWFQLPLEVSRVNDRAGVLFISLLFIAVFRPSYVGLFEFPLERSIILKERFSGSYRLSSYYIAKMLAEIPFLFIHPTIFFVILYFIVGFKLTVSGFFISYISFILAAYCCDSFGLVISSLTGSNIKAAILLLDSFLMSFSNVAGYWNPNMPPFISWMRYISPITYSYQGILINEFSDTNWTSLNGTITGEELIGHYNLWFTNSLCPILITIGWTIVYRILSFLILQIRMR